MCSCETPACVQEDRKSPLSFSLPPPQAHGCWVQLEAGTDVERVCSESTPVVVDQEMYPKQVAFLWGFS